MGDRSGDLGGQKGARHHMSFQNASKLLPVITKLENIKFSKKKTKSFRLTKKAGTKQKR